MRISPVSPGLWLAVSSAVGIAHMSIGGSPSHYPAINAAALGFALATIRFVLLPDTRRAAITIAASAIVCLVVPILVGPDVDGARRWIGLGPVQLHSGMLVLPMLAVVLPQLRPPLRIAMMALAAIAVSIQPDRASALALLAGAGALLYLHKSSPNAALLLIAGLAVGATFAQPDILEPVRFVENVLSDAWRDVPVAAVILFAALCATLFFPVIGNRKLLPLAAVFAGFTIASLIGAYPVPFIGYGASSILGYGLAVAAARQPVQ